MPTKVIKVKASTRKGKVVKAHTRKVYTTKTRKGPEGLMTGFKRDEEKKFYWATPTLAKALHKELKRQGYEHENPTKKIRSSTKILKDYVKMHYPPYNTPKPKKGPGRRI
jgi:hypothetical protein